ncbi:riboflavin-specific deaminase-like protein [Dichotomicrobium thermohalophilum]|uniref:Riboflavin-specific deaminase-like protein n=1 Tax=Dichotomicrobium thermohalophilum TaxID=933063 RepID=A0A397Q654_9HYPH|nr:riboflavin-specific deaminase-like protein [Dichotomicrobium thermohalophilum]
MTVEPFDSPLACLTACDPARPFVIAQLGQTLDGRIATQTGASKYINGAGALDHLHCLRAAVDGVVVGIGTVLADDPELTVRRADGRNPARIIIDPNARLPQDAKCLTDDGARVLVIRAHAADCPDRMEQVLVNREANGLCPREIVAALFARGFRKLLVEGGAQTISRFIEAGALDRLHILMAPMIIGSGKPGLVLPPIDSLSQALRPRTHAYPLPDGDVIFDCDMRRNEGSERHGDGNGS